MQIIQGVMVVCFKSMCALQLCMIRIMSVNIMHVQDEECIGKCHACFSSAAVYTHPLNVYMYIRMQHTFTVTNRVTRTS